MTIDQRQSAIVAEALSWEGTPFHVGACVKGVTGGVDCAGLVMSIFAAMGMVNLEPLPFIDPRHACHNEKSLILEWLRKRTDLAKDVSELMVFDENVGQRGIEIGDVICYRHGLCVHHCGIAISSVYTMQAVYPYGVTRFDMTGPYFRKHYQAAFRPLLLCR